MSASRYICITGPDGSGKTTQITKLAEHFAYNNANKVVAVTIWDMLLDPSIRRDIPFKAPREVDLYLSKLDNMARSLFLFHSLSQALALAQRKEPDVILLNAYWYKYFATEVAHGNDAGKLRAIAEQVFPEPESTFYLALGPEAAFERKTEEMLSGYETGFAEQRSQQAFVNFQQRAHTELEALAREKNWTRIDGQQPVTSITDTLFTAIND